MTKKKTVKTKAWAILYDKKKGGLCHYDGAFNDMPAVYFKKRTALYHADGDKKSVVRCEINYSL